MRYLYISHHKHDSNTQKSGLFLSIQTLIDDMKCKILDGAAGMPPPYPGRHPRAMTAATPALARMAASVPPGPQAMQAAAPLR